ncbi:MAG: hypothetical protein ACKO2G_00835 [Verrucomicrobiales bacterium]
MIYLLLPFFSGVFAWTSDPYGPKIFLDAHHYLLHRAGQFAAGRPLTGQSSYFLHKSAPWFYGIETEISDEEVRRRAKEAQERAEAALSRLREAQGSSEENGQ